MPLVMLSGCSGGGKSTLLAELAWRGYATIEEPGRRIVREEQASGGSALPWIDAPAFARRAIGMATADYEAARGNPGWTFFDRGIVDAASALEAMTGEPVLESLGHRFRYHDKVFMTPPWPELFASNAERQHGLDAAIEEYDRLVRDYRKLGYAVELLPKMSVSARADFVLEQLA
jgi:predicted ATPase